MRTPHVRAIRMFLLLACSFWTAGQARAQVDTTRYDVVVYGATPGGVAAAVAAAREGARVVLLEETTHIGGLATAGLSNTDFVTYESVGGFWRDFMDRVVAHYTREYGPNSPQLYESLDGGYYEPKVGLEIFRQMMAEQSNLTVLTRHRLHHVETEILPDGRAKVRGGRFRDVDTQRLRVLLAPVFIDGTYEGDLMAGAGAGYTVGGESRETYGESLANERADWRVQCYNFRPTLTTDPANRIPIPQPDGYDRETFLPIVAYIAQNQITDLGDLVSDDRPLPNRKADFNDEKGVPVSMKVCNETDIWPEAGPEVRAQLFEHIKNHNLGFLYFLQHDPALPAWVREEAGQWGLPRDEFVDSGHWPPYVYVREGRRMIGEYVFTQRDAQPEEGSVRVPAHEDAVAIGDYGLNSHGTYEPRPGVLLGEISGKGRPFQIPYRTMLPREVDGLLVPVALSASRVGFGAIRMEPAWSGLGEAAGIAAAMAVEGGAEVRDIDVDSLQARLHELKAITFYVTDVPPGSRYFRAVQYLGNRGYFQDLIDPADATDWQYRRIPGPSNHWSEAVPYHDVQPEAPMTAELAERWLRRAGLGADPEMSRARNLTRGEFLERLYQRVAGGSR